MRIIFLIIICLFSIKIIPGYATILFYEDFIDVTDWESNQETNKLCSDGVDKSFYAITCTTYCPPETSYSGDSDGFFDGAYFSSDCDCDDVTTQLYTIGDGYGDNKRGLRWKFQGDGYGNWHGGRLGLKIETPQTEIHLRYKAKFQSGFSWGPDGHGTVKFMDIYSFPPEWPVNGNPDFFTRFSGGLNQPGQIYTFFSNRSFKTQYQAEIATASRGAVPYCFPGNPLCPGVDGDAPVTNDNAWPSDGGWHFYEMRIKLNSAPDVADGEREFWLDGVQKDFANDITWVHRNNWQTGFSYTSYDPATSYLVPEQALKGFIALTTHTSGGVEPNWSSAVVIGDTVTDGNGNQWELITFFKFNNSMMFDNHYLGFSACTDQFVYIDNIVVSTTYIGVDAIQDVPTITGCTVTGCQFN